MRRKRGAEGARHAGAHHAHAPEQERDAAEECCEQFSAGHLWCRTSIAPTRGAAAHDRFVTIDRNCGFERENAGLADARRARSCGLQRCRLASVHRIVASRTASAQPRSNSSRLIHSSIVCASFCPAPKVTVGMPWRTIQLASSPPLAARMFGCRRSPSPPRSRASRPAACPSGGTGGSRSAP